MKKIENGDTVTLNYTGKLTNGNVFDTSLQEGREPLVAKLGEGNLIKGFESGLMGMSIGEKKTIEIGHDDAYGPYNDFLIQEVPMEQMPGDVSVGVQLQSETQMGTVVFTVKEVKEKGGKLTR
jgi:peptidylprolyl isomerase